MPAKPDTPTSQRTVLFVEDDQIVRESVAEVLELMGFRVIQAIDGEQAMEIIKTEIPDLIVVDWRLPGMSGGQFTSKIRWWRRRHAVRVIGVSAEDWHEEEMRKAGADSFFAKPLDVAALVDSLNE